MGPEKNGVSLGEEVKESSGETSCSGFCGLAEKADVSPSAKVETKAERDRRKLDEIHRQREAARDGRLPAPIGSPEWRRRQREGYEAWKAGRAIRRGHRKQEKDLLVRIIKDRDLVRALREVGELRGEVEFWKTAYAKKASSFSTQSARMSRLRAKLELLGIDPEGPGPRPRKPRTTPFVPIPAEVAAKEESQTRREAEEAVG